MAFTRLSGHLLAAVCLVLIAGCQLPRLPGTGGYYQVTDQAGKVYFTRDLQREARGVVEFRDSGTGAWISVAGAEIEPLSADEYRSRSAP